MASYTTIMFDLSEVLISGLVGIEKGLSPVLGEPEETLLLKFLFGDGEHVWRQVKPRHVETAAGKMHDVPAGTAAHVQQLCQVKPEMRHRFIFSTGDLANPRVQTFFQTSGCHYVCKPFKLESVLEVIDQVGRVRQAA